jgi:DNA-binding MarR family transcriptional regulator
MTSLAPDDDISKHGSFARQVIAARRLITRYFDPDLFADPAMDILLDLYAAGEENKKVCTSSACIAAAVPSTTALRWIARLKAAHLIEEKPDPADGRRKWLSLTPKAHARMTAFLEKINPRIARQKAN